MQFTHKPVLLKETLAVLAPQPGEIFVDGTVGGGGHSREILKRILPGGRLIAIDQDNAALTAAAAHLHDYAHAVTFVQRNFSELATILAELGVEAVDGILFDIGIQLSVNEGKEVFLTRQPPEAWMNQTINYGADLSII